MIVAAGKQAGIISFSSEFSAQRSASDTWAGFCKALGKRLSTPGMGFLSSYSCQTESKAPRWRIHVTERKASFDVDVFSSLNNSAAAIRRLSFPTKGEVFDLLDEGFLQIAIARMLTESMPTGWAMLYKEDNLTFETAEQILPSPRDLFVYDLLYDKDKDLWIPRIRARLSRVHSGNGDNDQTAEYAVSDSYRPLKKGRTYWAAAVQEDGERQRKYEGIITDVLQRKRIPQNMGPDNFLQDLLLGGLRSSYTGFRYGVSVFQTDSVVTQVNMISILAEIGGGPLSGLRWYYDIFPEVSRGSGSEEEYFTLRRASLGWAFDFEVPTFLSSIASKVDVQPKIGLLDLKSRFFTTTATGEKAGLNFVVRNNYDLAVELGAEKAAPWFRVRLWSAFSMANFGFSNKNSIAVNSKRGGIDTYVDVFESGNWDVNLLGFGTIENLDISKDPSSIDPLGPPELYSFNSNIYFLGLGFTVSW